MKKYFLRICSMLLILSITASLMGCSNVYYERKECSQHINEFMDCVFRRDAETLSTMAYMDSIDLQMINYYKTDAFMSKAIEKASYEVYMDNVRQFNQKIYFDVFINFLCIYYS